MARRGSAEWKENIAKTKRGKTGPEASRWLGDLAKPRSKQTRGRRAARALYALPDTCELCPAPAAVRHHRDRNTDNNAIDNIQFLCQSCHMKIDNPKHRTRGKHGTSEV